MRQHRLGGDFKVNVAANQKNGGLGSGGLNFDTKVRRESIDMSDIFISRIGGLDSFARSLGVAHKLINESPLVYSRQSRYASYDSGPGSEFEQGRLSLVDLGNIAVHNGEPTPTSARLEWFGNLVNQYI